MYFYAGDDSAMGKEGGEMFDFRSVRDVLIQVVTSKAAHRFSIAMMVAGTEKKKTHEIK